jgi:hypothetical protein
MPDSKKKTLGELVDEIEAKEESAVNIIHGNNENFEAIKRSYLEDKLLYEDSGGQEKRKFMSKLFLKVFEDILPLDGKKWRAIDLFNHSKKI